MPTPHISARAGEIAPTVLMPGDPLRAKQIATAFLQDVQMFNQVRGMLGFTGRWQGKPVSVMGSGMGMPSIGIYSYELFESYGVEQIIRVGSAGAYLPELKLYDILLAESCWSESSFAQTMSGHTSDIAYPNSELTHKLIKSAETAGITLNQVRVHSSDVFYRKAEDEYWHRIIREHGCACVEMESFALFHNAAVMGKSAACLLTVSDSLATREATSAAERESGFMEMVRIALGVL